MSFRTLYKPDDLDDLDDWEEILTSPGSVSNPLQVDEEAMLALSMKQQYGRLYVEHPDGRVHVWVRNLEDAKEVRRRYGKMPVHLFGEPYVIVDNTPKPKRFGRRLLNNPSRVKAKSHTGVLEPHWRDDG